MNCHVCEKDNAALYGTVDGSMLVALCPRCAAKRPHLKSIVRQTEACGRCGHLGKCCRTHVSASPAG